MATTAEIRAWAAENGHPELRDGRGKIPDDVRAGYDAAHPAADDYGPGTSPDDFGGDGLGWVAADEPSSGGDGLPPEEEPDVAAEPEERPSRPHTSRPRFGWRKKTTGKDTPPKTGKARGSGRKVFKRVSVAPLIEDAYTDMAWAAGAIPPLSRLLYAQAPIAGTVLDPVVKDTVGDRVLLQPAARNYERIKVGMALLGTPAALMGVLATAPGPVLVDGQPVWVPVVGPDGQPTGQQAVQMEAPSMRHQIAMLNLRYAVRAMADVAGDSLKRVKERAQHNEDRDATVNEFIAFLLNIDEVPADAEKTAAREGREAGLRLAGATIGE